MLTLLLSRCTCSKDRRHRHHHLRRRRRPCYRPFRRHYSNRKKRSNNGPSNDNKNSERIDDEEEEVYFYEYDSLHSDDYYYNDESVSSKTSYNNDNYYSFLLPKNSSVQGIFEEEPTENLSSIVGDDDDRCFTNNYNSWRLQQQHQHTMSVSSHSDENLNSDNEDDSRNRIRLPKAKQQSSSPMVDIHVESLRNESHSARKLRATSNVRRPPSCLSPDYYLDAMIYERGYSVQRYSAIHSGYYNEPTPLQEECYQSWILDLIARNDKAAFKLLLECGLVNNPSNYFGSTAAHFAAKHGRIDILKLMIKYGCDIRIADEHGKTPLHSACIGRPGNQKTNFDMIEFIAKVDIRLFHLADTKGNVPLSYIPRNQWGMYNEFIESLLLDKYWPGRRAILMKYGEEAPPPLAVSKPNVRNEITRRIFTKFDKIINSASMDVTTTSSDDDDHDSCHSRMMESVFSNGSKDLYKRHSSSIVKILLSTITEQKKKMDIYHHPGDLATSYYDSNCSLKNAKSTSEGKIIDNCTTSLYDTIMARSQQFYRNADISDASKLHVGTESAKDVRNKSNSPLIDARSSDIAAKPEGGGYLGSAISTAVAQCDIYAGNNTGASLCSDHLSSTSAVGLVANKENDSSICFSIVDTNHNNDSSRASDDNAFVVELKQQHHSARNAVSPCSASLKKSTRQHQRLINHTSRNDLRISGDSFITKFRNNTLDRTNHSAPQATTNRTCSGSESRYNSTNADSKNVSERNIQNAVTRKNDIKSLVAALQNIAIRSGTSKVHNMNLGGCNDEQRKPQLKPRSTRSLQSIGSVIASSEASSRKRASMTRTCRATSLRRGFSIERIDV